MQSPSRRALSPRPLGRRSSRREAAQPMIDTLQTLLSPSPPSRQPSASRNHSKGLQLPRKKSSRSSDSTVESRQPGRRASRDGRDGLKERKSAEFLGKERVGSLGLSDENDVVKEESSTRRVNFAGCSTKSEYLPGDSSDEEEVVVVAMPRGRARERGPGRRSATPFVRRRFSSVDEDADETDDDTDLVDRDIGNVDNLTKSIRCEHCGNLVVLGVTAVEGVNVEPRD